MSYRIPLRDLCARFLAIEGDGWRILDTRELTPECQGLWFTCPCHYVMNGNSDIGVHKILCWFRNRSVPDSLEPGPGRWTPVGAGIDDLTFDYGEPAVAKSVQSDCHFFITRGFATEEDK